MIGAHNGEALIVRGATVDLRPLSAAGKHGRASTTMGILAIGDTRVGMLDKPRTATLSYIVLLLVDLLRRLYM